MRSQCARTRLEIHTRAAVNLCLIGAVLHYGVDEEGPLPDEQLSTVVVEEMLGDI